MWIRDVDFPEELLQAARDGTLVVFVGAGASFDQPAGLPGFARLTSDIASEAGMEQADRETADAFLGRIFDSGVDVHARVRAHLDLPGSRPNRLHEAIIDLVQAI